MTETAGSEIVSQGADETAERRSTIFIGPDGLRAGWSLALFFLIFALIAATAVGIGTVVSKARAGKAGQVEGTAEGRVDGDARSRTQGTEKAGQPPKKVETKAVGMIVAESVSLLAVLAATWVMAKIERRRFLSFGMDGRRQAGRFAAGLFWGVACLSLLILLLVKTHLLAIDGVSLHGAEAWKYAGLWTIAFMAVSLLEETLVRGYVLVTLARGLAGRGDRGRARGFFWASLVMGVVFGAMHGGNPGESPVGLISAGLVGVVFAFSFWRTGSLWWAIGFHAAWDWAQSYLYGVADSGTYVQGHLLTAHVQGNPMFSGGSVGPEGSVFILPVLLLATAIVAVTLKKDSVGV